MPILTYLDTIYICHKKGDNMMTMVIIIKLFSICEELQNNVPSYRNLIKHFVRKRPSRP